MSYEDIAGQGVVIRQVEKVREGFGAPVRLMLPIILS